MLTEAARWEKMGLEAAAMSPHMDVEAFQSTEQGFAVVGLRTARAELTMVPSLGGRVIGLRSRRTGRQWCWHRPRADWLWPSRAGDDFGGSPQAGIDECVPSVAGCAWRGRIIPDHGEVWYQPWSLDPGALERQELSATVPLTVSPLVFRRAIRADETGGFVFDYQLTNIGAEAEPFLWSLHPLFAIAAGDRLELPAEVDRLRLNGGLGDRPIAFGDSWAYPEPFAGVRLDRLEVPGMPKGCVKAFAGPLGEGRAALVNDATGDRLELRWNPQETPMLGLWLNRGHVGFHHVALEPTNGAPDSLADAVDRWNQFGTVAAGATVRWSIAWQVS
jgi:hypothetical protein